MEKRRRTASLCAPWEIRLLRKRKPSAFGYLTREETPIAEEWRGIAISAFGKVIRRGWDWDWLGVTPADPERVGGLIEAAFPARWGESIASARNLSRRRSLQ